MTNVERIEALERDMHLARSQLMSQEYAITAVTAVVAELSPDEALRIPKMLNSFAGTLRKGGSQSEATAVFTEHLADLLLKVVRLPLDDGANG